MADTKIQPGLIEPDELSQFPSAANQLGRFGIDPDMARANPELLAPLNPQAAQASAPIAPSRPAGGGTDYGMLAANEPAAAIPSPSIVAPGKVGGASAAPTPTAAPDITAPVPPRTATDQGAAGLDMMRRNADAAMTAAAAPPTRNPEEDRLRAQQGKLAAPRLNDPVTGKMLSQVPEYDPATGKTIYINPKASVGQKIWRGVRGGLTGLALGGVRGAVVGALNPQDMPGGTAYGAPDSAFQKAEAVREQELGDTNNALATARQNWKDQQDAAEARQGKAVTAARELTTGANSAQTAAAAEQRAKTAQQIADNKPDVQPKTYEELVTAAQLEQDPAKKAAYKAAADQIQKTEVKKFAPRPSAQEQENASLTAAWHREHPGERLTVDVLKNLYARGGRAGDQNADTEVGSIVADATGKKQAFADQYIRMADGRYRGPSGILSAEQFQTKLDQFRDDANVKLAKKGAQIDAQGNVVRVGMPTGAGAPAVAAAPSVAPPKGALGTIKGSDGRTYWTSDGKTGNLGLAGQ